MACFHALRLFFELIKTRVSKLLLFMGVPNEACSVASTDIQYCQLEDVSLFEYLLGVITIRLAEVRRLILNVGSTIPLPGVVC